MRNVLFHLFFVLIAVISVEALPQIEAFNEQGVSLGLIQFANGTLDGAKQYVVGTGPHKLVFWQPWEGQDLHVNSLLFAMQHFINSTAEDKELYRIELWCVGWDKVGNTRVCSKKSMPCPDIIVLGTTQIATRVVKEEAYSLEDYFALYTYDSGNVLSDDFLNPFFYEFYFRDGWYAVPLITDTRSLFFNKTTFDALNLTYPPPYGDWSKPYSKSWTWEVFTDYANRISKWEGGDGVGFKVDACYDEEFKIMMMVAQSWNVRILNKNNNTCGLRDPKFVEAVSRTVDKWLRVDKSMDRLFAFDGTDLEKLMNWKRTEYNNPLAQPNFDMGRCRGATQPLTFTGMMIETTSVMMADVNNTEIEIGFPPGQKSFLGGSGMMITSGSKRKDLAWRLITFLINPQLSWIHYINEQSYSCPPYESALNMDPWDTDTWKISREILRMAVPAQYPLSTFPQFGELEKMHPIRKMWMDIAFKNYSVVEAIERACIVVDYIFLPDCKYDEDSRACIHLPFNSATAIVCLAIAGGLILFAIFLSFLFFRRRAEPPIRRSSWRFAQVIIWGCIMVYGFVFLSFGKPTDLNCKARIWLLALGFSLAFGSTSLKVYRIQVIFHRSLGKSLRFEFPDKKLFKILPVIVAGEVLLLALWTWLPNSGAEVRIEQLENYGDAPYLLCSLGSIPLLTLLFAYNGVIALWGCYNCWLARDVPSEYNEKKFIFYSLLSVMFCCIILVPLIFTFPDKYWATVLAVLGVMFATTMSLWVFCIPKLAQIYWPSEKQRVTELRASAPTPGAASV